MSLSSPQSRCARVERALDGGSPAGLNLSFFTVQPLGSPVSSGDGGTWRHTVCTGHGCRERQSVWSLREPQREYLNSTGRVASAANGTSVEARAPSVCQDWAQCLEFSSTALGSVNIWFQPSKWKKELSNESSQSQAATLPPPLKWCN